MQVPIYSWICDKKSHLVIKSVAQSDATPDCPQCHCTMEAWPHEMEIDTINNILMPLIQETMSDGERPFYWYNITQTCTFHIDGRIDIVEHETLDT